MTKQTDTAEATADSAAQELLTIEALRQKKETPGAIFRGVCAAFGWGPGKMVTEDTYDASVVKFSETPIGKKVE